jgi:hypothetical protein
MFPSVIFPSPVILSACAYAGGVIDAPATKDVTNTVVVKTTIAAAKMEVKTNLFQILVYYIIVLYQCYLILTNIHSEDANICNRSENCKLQINNISFQ